MRISHGNAFHGAATRPLETVVGIYVLEIGQRDAVVEEAGLRGREDVAVEVVGRVRVSPVDEFRPVAHETPG